MKNPIKRLLPPLVTTTEYFEGGICIVRYPTVTVDYAAIARAGGYAGMLAQAHDEGRDGALEAGIIAGRFPVIGEGAFEIEPALLGFHESRVSSEVALLAVERLEADGSPWSLGGIAELCAVTGANPWLQSQEGSILAIGSAIVGDDGRTVAPRACSCPGPEGGRRLDLQPVSEHGEWPAYCSKFLIVRRAPKVARQQASARRAGPKVWRHRPRHARCGGAVLQAA